VAKALKLTPQDLYRLRRASLAAQRAEVEAGLARQRLREVTLEVERRYGLLGSGAAVDVGTGEIRVDGAGGENGERGSSPP